ncbi:MAG TPA: hypothetical protein VG015_02495, partial [Candidatus Dormibacteraeota bacterium]|nr:hypothetical protein [Candidatus Dormibacteraeota bacterium]
MIRKANRQLLTGVSKAYADHVNYRRQAALRALSSFLLTFIFLRGLTAVIHFHLLPIHDITTGSGLHIHHFVWGIFILIAVG